MGNPSKTTVMHNIKMKRIGLKQHSTFRFVLKEDIYNNYSRNISETMS